jgi:hypothetical protein
VKIITDVAMIKGKYDLFLYMPDKYSSIAHRPEYAIRLANNGCLGRSNSYNKLNTAITIE